MWNDLNYFIQHYENFVTLINALFYFLIEHNKRLKLFGGESIVATTRGVRRVQVITTSVYATY